MNEVRKILSSDPLSLNMEQVEVSPGSALSSEGSLSLWIRQNVYTYSHWVGTARMGKGNNSSDASSIEDSVVDPNLRVRGTSNLHVVDASIMPSIPNGNVHSTVTVIGYRAADLLSGDSIEQEQ